MMLADVLQCVMYGFDNRPRGNGCASHKIELSAIFLDFPTTGSWVAQRFSVKYMYPWAFFYIYIITQARGLMVRDHPHAGKFPVGSDADQKFYFTAVSIGSRCFQYDGDGGLVHPRLPGQTGAIGAE